MFSAPLVSTPALGCPVCLIFSPLIENLIVGWGPGEIQFEVNSFTLSTAELWSNFWLCLSYLCCILPLSVSYEKFYSWNMSRIIVNRGARCSDPQQTGFKGNLRLLIKPFEQPHLPFKILSAALRCSGLNLLCPAATSHLSVWSGLLCSQSKGPNDLLHLAFSLCPAEMTHDQKVTCNAHSALLLSCLCPLMLWCIFRGVF